MPTPPYLLALPRLDDVVRRPGPGGAYERAVLYTDADAVGALVYGDDGAAFERAGRAFFEVRAVDGGGRRVRFERPTLRAVVVRPRDRAVAERWALARVPVRAVLLGAAVADHVVWDRPAVPVVLGADAGGVSGLAVELSEPSAGTDAPHAPGGSVRRSPDLLAGALDGLLLGGYAEDPDRPGAGLARGLTVSDGDAVSVAGGEQLVSLASGDRAHVEASRVLPAPGLHVVAEAVVSGPGGAGLAESGHAPGDVSVELAALDVTGGVLAVYALPVVAAGGPEVAAPGLTLPTGTWRVRVRVVVTGPAGGGPVALSSLRLLTVDPTGGDVPGAAPLRFGVRVALGAGEGGQDRLLVYPPASAERLPDGTLRLTVPDAARVDDDTFLTDD